MCRKYQCIIKESTYNNNPIKETTSRTNEYGQQYQEENLKSHIQIVHKVNLNNITQCQKIILIPNFRGDTYLRINNLPTTIDIAEGLNDKQNG